MYAYMYVSSVFTACTVRGTVQANFEQSVYEFEIHNIVPAIFSGREVQLLNTFSCKLKTHGISIMRTQYM